jgi:hypothetical protein
MSDHPNAEVLAAIAALDAKFDAKIDAKFDSLQSQVTRFRTDTMERIDRLQARVDAIHDDLKVVEGTSNAALLRSERAQKDNDSLLEMQTTLNRMMRRANERLNKLEDGSGSAA